MGEPRQLYLPSIPGPDYYLCTILLKKQYLSICTGLHVHMYRVTCTNVQGYKQRGRDCNDGKSFYVSI